MQAGGRLPGAVSNTGDAFTKYIGPLQGHPFAIARENVPVLLQTGDAHLHAFERRIDVPYRTADRPFLAGHVPRLERLAQLAGELTELLNRYRLAGYESVVSPPRYAALDIEVTVCAKPDAYRGDVLRAVMNVLDGRTRADGKQGFFHPDRFTFGVPLERSALEAAVDGVPEVGGVMAISYRRRGFMVDTVDMPDLVEVGIDEVIRVDNNPNLPEGGSLKVEVVGGK